MSEDALIQFAAHQRSQGLAETTIRNRASIVGALATFTGTCLLEVDIRDLRAFTGRNGIKQSSRRTERNALIAFFTFAAQDGLREDDPSRRLGPVKVPRTEPRPFSKDQIDRMLTSGAYRKTRAMIVLGYYQGFRVSTIARVHGQDLDLIEGTIRVVVKGGKEATLPLHPVVAELALTMPADTWWFPGRGGRQGPIRPGSVSDLIADAKHRAGILDPHLTAHSLRHSFGTHLVDEGVDIRVVQELMTHESLSSTQIYTGVSTRLKREGLAALPSMPVPQHSGRLHLAA
jgi:integrase/recombinase XerD